MRRIVDSARKVWGRLNAKLRELERRNHRLEDLGARLGELAKAGEDAVPYAWFARLLETAAMRGDAQVRPGGEKSVHPLPKAAAIALKCAGNVLKKRTKILKKAVTAE